jgi:hypothetical protein
MWLCLRDGFISVVEHRRRPGVLVVRARNPDHLRKLFPGKKIYVRKGSDYPARVFVKRYEFAEFLVRQASEIDYSNFKNAVTDDELHDNMYLKMWEVGRQYQKVREAEQRYRQERQRYQQERK